MDAQLRCQRCWLGASSAVLPDKPDRFDHRQQTACTVNCTAAIVAGGPASRFEGRDKSALLIAGRSILERQISVLGSVTDRIMIVAGDVARFSAVGLPVVADLVPGAAAIGAVYTAINAARTENVLVVACDMPFLTRAFLEHLIECATDADLVIPHPADGYQPLCAVYARGCIGPIRSRIASRALRVQDLATEVRTREIGPDELARFDPDGLLFFNVNTPGDHARAEHLALHHDGQHA
jgi:molybdopterin-guanine dinucleotide biosynthesis protein A